MNLTGSPAQAQGGILKELLRSTLLKDLLRIRINALHPESSRDTVKTLLGEDPEVFFGMVSALPVLVNSLLAALTELAIQLKDKYPPGLLKSFIASIVDDIDGDAAVRCGRAWADLADSLLQASPELKNLAIKTVLAKGPGIKAGALNAFSRFANGISRDDPQAIGRFVSGVRENVDGEELGKAAAVIANAFLDQKWHLASWTWNLVKGRIRRRLKAFG
jgi:hypothetical protein